MKIIEYPDGSSYAQAAASDTEFTFRLNSYDDLWKLHQAVDACNSIGLIPIVTIPNLIDAQADRRFNENESSGLKLVGQFLNNMNANFKIFHPHNSEVVTALMNNVEIIDNSEFVVEVLSHIGWSKDNRDNLILMSSDSGGFKPLMKVCDKIGWKGETFSASKSRSWDEVDGTKFVQQIDRQDFGGKDVLIIDDISIYGGTFKGLAKMLRERNCGKLYLAVSHMTVRHLGSDDVTRYFDKVFTTNSKYDSYIGYSDNTPKNLQIINLF